MSKTETYAHTHRLETNADRFKGSANYRLFLSFLKKIKSGELRHEQVRSQHFKFIASAE